MGGNLGTRDSGVSSRSETLDMLHEIYFGVLFRCLRGICGAPFRVFLGNLSAVFIDKQVVLRKYNNNSDFHCDAVSDDW